MDYKSIQELIKFVSNSKLSFFEVESEGIHIKMEKSQNSTMINSVPDIAQVSTQSEPILAQYNNAAAYTSETIEKAEVKTAEIMKNEGTLVTSPIVGTFYAAPGPNAKPFVKVGSKVMKGDVLCIIEAMKLMNEIESDVTGEIVEILVKDDQMVEFGQPLFRIV